MLQIIQKIIENVKNIYMSLITNGEFHSFNCCDS